MEDILNQLPTLPVIWQLIQDGFFLGALAGAIVGTLTWTLMERSNFSLVPLAITALLGLILGIYLEGNNLQVLVDGDWQSFFTGSIATRSDVLATIFRILGWMLGFTVIGAIISSYRLALGGFVMGTISGILSGMLILILGQELGYPVESPITIVLIVIISILLLVLISMSRDPY